MTKKPEPAQRGDQPAEPEYPIPSVRRILRNIAIVLVLLAVPAAAWMIANGRNEVGLSAVDGPVNASEAAHTLYVDAEPAGPITCTATTSDGQHLTLAPASGILQERVAIGSSTRYWAVADLPHDRGPLTTECTSSSTAVTGLRLGPAPR